MKKLLILIFLISTPFLYSAAISPRTEALNLNAYVGTQAYLSLELDDTELYVSSGVWSFKLTDSSVAPLDDSTYINGTGFRFASWSFITTDPSIRIVVSHDYLTCVDNVASYIDYSLGVEYSKSAPYDVFVKTGEEISFVPDYVGDVASINNYGLFIRLIVTDTEIEDLDDGVYTSIINFRVETT